MNDGETNRRSDRALLVILDETAAWAVRGEHGAPLGQTASLRDALTMASALERAGRTIRGQSVGYRRRRTPLAFVDRGHQRKKLRASARDHGS